MKTYGNAVTGGTYTTTVPDLPRDLTYRPHRPWCVDCKRKHDADQLDDNSRCERCAKAAIVKAEQAARREAEEAERRARAPLPAPAPRPKPRPTRPVARRQPTRAPRPRRDPNARQIAALTRRRDSLTARLAKLDEELTHVEEQLAQLRRQPETTPKPPPPSFEVFERATRRDKIDLPAQPIIDAYTAGATLRTLAEQHDVSAPTIARLLDEHHVTRRKQRIDYTPDLIDQVRRLYLDEHHTQEQVADKLDVTLKVVQTAMRRGEIPARDSASDRSQQGIGHPIKIQPHQHPEIIDRYQAGDSAPLIAAAYNVAPTSIYHVLNRHGITERHNKRSTPGEDRAAHIGARIAELGATSRAIKAWGLEHGLVDRITRGRPTAALVDAYAAAHPTTERSAS